MEIQPFLPTSTQGETILHNCTFSCVRDVKDGVALAIQFLNQGTASIVALQYNGVSVILKPGSGKGRGDMQMVAQPSGCYDTTEYKIFFYDDPDSEDARIDNLLIRIIKLSKKYIHKEK